MWAKWKWDNEMYSDDWEGLEKPGCLGPDPSSITHQLCSPWASDLNSSCLSFLICKVGVIMVASPNCYKDWMNKGDTLREMPGTQRVLRHVSGCFGKTNRDPQKCFLPGKSINLDPKKQLLLAKPEYQQEPGAVEASNRGLWEMFQGLRL